MKISVIASGSKGNACYIESNNTKIIIDCGISYKRIVNFFNTNNINMNIDAMLITHEHVDHVQGLKMFAKNNRIPIYMTSGTKEGIIEKYRKDSVSPIDFCDVKIIGSHDEFVVGDIHIKSIPLSHDVYEPVGYILNDNNTKMVYITDTGFVPQTLYQELSNADIYVMETNHDPELLMACESRPYETRIRILNEKGHLSNEDGIDLLAHVMGDNTKLVFYAHISDECNLFNLIDMASKKIFKMYQMDVSKIEFVYTSQIATKVYEI